MPVGFDVVDGAGEDTSRVVGVRAWRRRPGVAGFGFEGAKEKAGVAVPGGVEESEIEGPVGFGRGGFRRLIEMFDEMDEIEKGDPAREVEVLKRPVSGASVAEEDAVLGVEETALMGLRGEHGSEGLGLGVCDDA